MGFIALCAAMAVGAVMIARGMALVFSGRAQEAYSTGGVLKPMHAVTMHGILVLPLLAWLVSLAAESEPQRVKIVRVAAIGYGLLIAVVTAANLIGWI